MEKDPSGTTPRPKALVIMDKGSLLPVGVVSILLLGAFQLGAEWTRRGTEIDRLTRKAETIEKRVTWVEKQQIFWRREVEKKLGPIPDYKGVSQKGEVEHGRGRRTVQANQVRLSSGGKNWLD